MHHRMCKKRPHIYVNYFFPLGIAQKDANYLDRIISTKVNLNKERIKEKRYFFIKTQKHTIFFWRNFPSASKTPHLSTKIPSTFCYNNSRLTQIYSPHFPSFSLVGSNLIYFFLVLCHFIGKNIGLIKGQFIYYIVQGIFSLFLSFTKYVT